MTVDPEQAIERAGCSANIGSIAGGSEDFGRHRKESIIRVLTMK
jgi:hypothetical protein